MSCQVIESPMGTMFVCGVPVPVTRYCRFCLAEGHKRKALKLCDWPVGKAVEVSWREIQIGDTWVTSQKGLHGKVVAMEADRGPNGYLYSAKFWVKLPKHSYPYPYDRYGEMTVLTTREGMPCSAPCCFRHRRHVGPGRDYCKDHWNSWMEA